MRAKPQGPKRGGGESESNQAALTALCSEMRTTFLRNFSGKNLYIEIDITFLFFPLAESS